MRPRPAGRRERVGWSLTSSQKVEVFVVADDGEIFFFREEEAVVGADADEVFVAADDDEVGGWRRGRC